jgi:deoxyuridine 5'-triphosphate nucleotidohydrolase
LKPGGAAAGAHGAARGDPAGFELQIRPRSGLALKHGVGLPNSPGTIDSDYRGPLGVILVNFGETAFRVRHGARIAQAVVAPVVGGAVRGGEALDATARGGGLWLHRGGLMLFVLIIAAALWGLGHLMKAPVQARLYMLGLLYLAVLAVQVALPPRQWRCAPGGGRVAGGMAGTGRAGGAGVGYRAVLARIRARAETVEAGRAEPGRAARALRRRGAGALRPPHHVARDRRAGQKALKQASVLVIGAGGLARPRSSILRRRAWGGSG